LRLRELCERLVLRMPGELILTVDDEVRIGELVGMYLQKDGFRHIAATNGKQAMELAEKERPNLIVLDVLLPDMEGYELCSRLRTKTDVPIVFLSCKDTDVDKVVGLTVGADDYMSKPFSPIELIARIKAQLRRFRAQRAPQPPKLVLSNGHVQLHPEAHEVFVEGRKIELTTKEFQLLSYMMHHAKQVLTPDQLLLHVWGYDSSVDTKTLKVHIGHLRKKIEHDPSQPKRIITVRGVGYKFDERVQEA